MTPAKLPRVPHYKRDRKTGRYAKTWPCDACGKPVGTSWFTDADVCGNSDGPGFMLCERAACMKKRDLEDIEARRALYAAQRTRNDAHE